MKIGTIAGAVAGGITMFLLGFLVFAVLLEDYFRENMIAYSGLLKDPPVVWAIFLFNLTWAALIAFVLDYAGRSGWAEGAKAGTIVMFLLALGIDLDFFAFMNVHKSVAPIIVHILVISIMGGISGAVIGVVMGLFGRRTADA